jgi:hypothetical protein
MTEKIKIDNDKLQEALKDLAPGKCRYCPNVGLHARILTYGILNGEKSPEEIKEEMSQYGAWLIEVCPDGLQSANKCTRKTNY